MAATLHNQVRHGPYESQEISTLEQCMSSVGPDDSYQLGLYRQHIESFYTTRLRCIAAQPRLPGCVYCLGQKIPCGQTWASITKSVRLLNRRSGMPDSVTGFANYLRIALSLDLCYVEAREAIDSLDFLVDDDFTGLQQRLKTLKFRGNTTVQALLHGATSEMWFCIEKPRESIGIHTVEKTREMYSSLAASLADSPGPDPTRPLPLLRNAGSLQFSGDITFATLMLGNCYFGEYIPSSIPLVLEIFAAWLPSRQSDFYECFVPTNHLYVGTGLYNCRDELEAYNARGIVHFTTRKIIPRLRRPYPLDISSFRDIMVFRSQMLVSDSVSRDNRDISAFMQTAAQLASLTLPSDAGDLWSGLPLVELGRVDLYIRQVKHLTICTQGARNMSIIFSLLYAITSPRHNTRLRGRVSPDFEESISCCPAPFCGDDAPPCGLDRDLPTSRGSAQNPLRLVLEAVIQEGLSAEEWQAGIDKRVRLCHEWSCGLHPELGEYNPIVAAIDVAPMCLRIIRRVVQLIPGSAP